MRRKNIFLILLFLAAFSVKAQSIFVVRHAEKAVNQGNNPALSSNGVEQAQRLKFLLVEKKLQNSTSAIQLNCKLATVNRFSFQIRALMQ